MVGAPDALPSPVNRDDANLVVPTSPAPTVSTATAATAVTSTPTATATTAGRTSATATATTEVASGWARLIHSQSAALQRLTVKASDSPFHIFALVQFDKSEAPRLTRHLIAYDDG